MVAELWVVAEPQKSCSKSRRADESRKPWCSRSWRSRAPTLASFSDRSILGFALHERWRRSWEGSYPVDKGFLKLLRELLGFMETYRVVSCVEDC